MYREIFSTRYPLVNKYLLYNKNTFALYIGTGNKGLVFTLAGAGVH